MSATAIPTGEAEAPQEPVAKTATAARIFKYNEFVDIGEGAAECEHGRDGLCEDPSHFHAWCRLPNRFQDEDIRGKAQAAKARRVRALKDPESDLSVILDSALAPLADERFLDTLLDELIQEDLPSDYIEAQNDVREREEFEHFEADREEYDRLHAIEGDLSEEEQSAEYKQLRAHVGAYLDALQARLGEIQQPKREELAQRPFDSLIELVRAKRIEEESSRAFFDTYNAWAIYVGTFSPEPHELLKKPFKPRWDDIGQRDRPIPGTMYGEEEEVLAELSQVFTRLRSSFREGSRGN